MLRSLFLAAVLAAVAASLPVESDLYSAEQTELLFNAWSSQHGFSFSDAEAPSRLAIFTENLNFVARHNQEAAAGKHTFTVEMNKYAAMSREEYKAMLGFRPAANAVRNAVAINGSSAPASIDWRQKGAVTPVKNQGQCGSCWAFSAVGALEGANFIKTGKLVSLSEQELLDCDKVDGACNGGLMDNAFDFVEQNGGIDTEDDWKYLARQTIFFRCPASKKAKHAGTCSAHTDVPANDESQLQLASAQQPVSVAIDASGPSFQLYKSGIMSNTDCGTTLDHGVLLVGYGTEGTQDYWIVKNSWGAAWGEEGYIRFARNVADKAGECGIAMAASYPTA